MLIRCGRGDLRASLPRTLWPSGALTEPLALARQVRLPAAQLLFRSAGFQLAYQRAGIRVVGPVRSARTARSRPTARPASVLA